MTRWAPKWAARKDANQNKIVQALIRVGASVFPTNQKGVPDLSVGYRGRNYYLEVKNKDGKLTPDQVEWMAQWRGSYAIVRTVDEALRAIGALAED